MQQQDLISYFEKELFLPSLKARSKEEAFSEMVEVLFSQKKIKEKEILLEMLRQRESLGSTGIGKGVAIPHGRSLAAPKLAMVFGKSKNGIAFDALDGSQVHLIFMIVAPYQDRQNLYLVALGKLAELLRKKKVRDELLDVSTFEEFKKVIEGGL